MAWGIVTNKPARFTDPLVPQIGLAHAGCIVSGDTTRHAKPHPAPLLEGARRLGLAPEQCWYVGDDLRDIEAGPRRRHGHGRVRLGLLRRDRTGHLGRRLPARHAGRFARTLRGIIANAELAPGAAVLS